MNAHVSPPIVRKTLNLLALYARTPKTCPQLPTPTHHPLFDQNGTPGVRDPTVLLLPRLPLRLLQAASSSTKLPPKGLDVGESLPFLFHTCFPALRGFSSHSEVCISVSIRKSLVNSRTPVIPPDALDISADTSNSACPKLNSCLSSGWVQLLNFLSVRMTPTPNSGIHPHFLPSLTCQPKREILVPPRHKRFLHLVSVC